MTSALKTTTKYPSHICKQLLRLGKNQKRLLNAILIKSNNLRPIGDRLAEALGLINNANNIRKAKKLDWLTDHWIRSVKNTINIERYIWAHYHE